METTMTAIDYVIIFGLMVIGIFAGGAWLKKKIENILNSQK